MRIDPCDGGMASCDDDFEVVAYNRREKMLPCFVRVREYRTTLNPKFWFMGMFLEDLKSPFLMHAIGCDKFKTKRFSSVKSKTCFENYEEDMKKYEQEHADKSPEEIWLLVRQANATPAELGIFPLEGSYERISEARLQVRFFF